MKLVRVVRILKGEILAGRSLVESITCKNACGSDLLSDVLAFCKEQTLLLTGLANAQVVRTAEIADLIAVILVRGKRPSSEMILIAEKVGIPLICTEYPMYESCGLLWREGLAGCELSPAYQKPNTTGE